MNLRYKSYQRFILKNSGIYSNKRQILCNWAEIKERYFNFMVHHIKMKPFSTVKITGMSGSFHLSNAHDESLEVCNDAF